MLQLTFFDKLETPKEIGIQQAVEHANRIMPDWSENAYRYLESYIVLHKRHHRFMTEDVRRAAELSLKVPIPPSKRAWGAIILRACKSGIIKKVGHDKVKNTNAHSAFASVWEII